MFNTMNSRVRLLIGCFLSLTISSIRTKYLHKIRMLLQIPTQDIFQKTLVGINLYNFNTYL